MLTDSLAASTHAGASAVPLLFPTSQTWVAAQDLQAAYSSTFNDFKTFLYFYFLIIYEKFEILANDKNVSFLGFITVIRT